MTGDGWHVRLDLGPQVLALAMSDREYRDPTGWLAPTCPTGTDRFVSASMLAVKAKLFDDGLFAAVEMASQKTKGGLVAALAGVTPLMAAAAHLGGSDAALSPEAEAIEREFLADELRSKPIGLYTWNDALRRVFQQDRLLQQQLPSADASALTAALKADAGRMSAYSSHLEFAAALTNPFPADHRDLRQAGGDRFFPASRSVESDLVKRLYAGSPVPEGFSLADELVARLRDGSLSVTPTEASGWYRPPSLGSGAIGRARQDARGSQAPDE